MSISLEMADAILEEYKANMRLVMEHNRTVLGSFRSEPVTRRQRLGRWLHANMPRVHFGPCEVDW